MGAQVRPMEMGTPAWIYAYRFDLATAADRGLPKEGPKLASRLTTQISSPFSEQFLLLLTLNQQEPCSFYGQTLQTSQPLWIIEQFRVPLWFCRLCGDWRMSSEI